MLSFAWPWVAAALPLPLLAALVAPPVRGGGDAALRVPFFAAVRAWPAGGTPRLWRWPLAATLVWVLLVGAGMRPQYLGQPIPVAMTGRDTLLAVDLSGSMRERDMRVGDGWESRLKAVKRIAGNFISRRHGDRVGLILFGTRAYLQAPLTFDGRTVREMLDEAEIGLAGEQTAIGDAIGLAVKRLRGRPRDSRVVILLTDGRNTAGEVGPINAARVAAHFGVRIYTIGVGAGDLMVHDFFGTRRVNPSAELDEHTLKAIARITGGRYFRARDARQLRQIYAELDKLEPAAAGDQVFRPVKELYAWPLGAALLAVALALAARLPRRRPRAWRASLRRGVAPGGAR